MIFARSASDVRKALAAEATWMIACHAKPKPQPQAYRRDQFGRKRKLADPSVKAAVKEALAALEARDPARAKPKPNRDKGVYVIGAAGHPVKIGITASIEHRLHAINTGSPVKLRVYLFLDAPQGCARQIEKICHFRLHDYRVNGEWFDLDWREAVDMVRKVTGEVTATAKAA